MFLASFVPLVLCAQTPVAAVPLPAPVPRDAGVYHFATGTWTAPDAAAPASASASLYCNTVPGSFFEPFGSETEERVDFGRIPSRSSVPVAGSSDAYIVDCLRFSYCTSAPTGAVDLTLRFYERFDPTGCPNPAGTLVAEIDAPPGLPGATGSGTVACWVVSLDLSNSSLEFTLLGDADGTFDSDPATDSFGIGVQFNDLSAGPAGVLYGGDCGSSSDACAGLGTDDYFFVRDGAAMACRNLGGCPSAPEASIWIELLGRGIGNLGTRYCDGAANSAGPGARMLVEGSTVVSDNDVTLRAAGCPAGVSGLFCFGSARTRAPFGDGSRCVGGTVRRVHPPVPTDGAGLAVSVLDLTAPPAAGWIAPGSTWAFQLWYQDAAAMGSGFNLSDGLEVAFQ